MHREALILAAALSLAGCATPSKQALAPEPATPLDQFKATVSEVPEEVALAVHPQGLSANQQTALSLFVSRWRDNGEGDVTVRSPTDGGAAPAARRTADSTMSFLARLGVPSQRLRLIGYEAHGAPGAPVVAAFTSYAATALDCREGWEDLTATGSNKTPKHFGCATTANLAAQIANPRDLVIPAETDPADNSRRQVILGKYRQGQITSSARDDQANGQVSGH